MRKSEKVTIGVVFGVMLLILGLSVGYATAFSQVLTINGTANVSQRNFVVKFKTATSKNLVTGSSAQVTSDNTVTITAPLTQPGDSETFDIVIENAGSLDAVLDSFVISEITSSGADAETLQKLKSDVKVETTGFVAKSDLAAGTTVSGTVKVTWDANSTNQYSKDVAANFTVTFNYIEKQ